MDMVKRMLDGSMEGRTSAEKKEIDDIVHYIAATTGIPTRNEVSYSQLIPTKALLLSSGASDHYWQRYDAVGMVT